MAVESLHGRARETGLDGRWAEFNADYSLWAGVNNEETAQDFLSLLWSRGEGRWWLWLPTSRTDGLRALWRLSALAGRDEMEELWVGADTTNAISGRRGGIKISGGEAMNWSVCPNCTLETFDEDKMKCGLCGYRVGICSTQEEPELDLKTLERVRDIFCIEVGRDPVALSAWLHGRILRAHLKRAKEDCTLESLAKQE